MCFIHDMEMIILASGQCDQIRRSIIIYCYFSVVGNTTILCRCGGARENDWHNYLTDLDMSELTGEQPMKIVIG